MQKFISNLDYCHQKPTPMAMDYNVVNDETESSPPLGVLCKPPPAAVAVDS
jgi:hypothetical protein